jgi:hypothetical protein
MEGCITRSQKNRADCCGGDELGTESCLTTQPALQSSEIATRVPRVVEVKKAAFLLSKFVDLPTHRSGSAHSAQV